MENEELNNNNQLPPHQVEEHEVAPRRDRILRDYIRPDHFEGESSVRRPLIAANNFEIRTSLIQTIHQSCQFTGDASEDPHTHLIDFLELVETCRNVIDAESGGSIMSKTTAEAMQLLNEISENVVQWSSDRMIVKKATRVNQVEAWNSLAQQIATLTQEAFQVQGPPGFQNQNRGQQDFQKYQQPPQKAHQQSLEDMMYKFIKATDEKVESQSSAINNLEIQMSQLATLMSEQIKSALPSNTEKNPKEHLKAISLRSGKTLDDPYADRQGKPHEVEQVNEGENKRDSELLEEQKEKEKKVQENEVKTNPQSVPLPFPQKMKRKNLDKQFSKFLDILKQLYINIPFTEALTQMPSYAKFLKEILSSKRKLEEVSVVKLTEKCSAILQNKLPQKLGDPESFTISCTVRGAHFEKALCDSGASIKLMPFSIFRKLELGEMKDTCVSLQLADQSTKRPKGIIENVLVRVDKFVFPVDFIVLEMEENTEVPLILGRPFLATGRAIIDVHQGQLILRVDEERLIFDMQKMIKFPENESSSSCFQIDLLDDLVDEFKDNQLITDSLERCLVRSGTTKQEYKLIEVLRMHKRALGWTIADNKGINPAICKHRILMEENYKPIVQPQRRLNPAMQEVVKKEVVKLLAAGIIYPISDSPWAINFIVSLTDILGIIRYRLLQKIRRKPHSHAPKRCMSAIFSDMTEKFLEIFMDDFTLFEVDKAKIDLIAGLSPPTTVKDDRRKAFEFLKEQLTNAPIVVSPDWSQPFEIMCDASDIAVGAILGQNKKIFRPIYYASRTLNEAQMSYATTEKELLAVVFALDKFRSYLIGTKVTAFTDHVALKYILTKKDARPRLLRWILLLQEFDLEIKDRKSSENQVADHLSRLENPPTEILDIQEEFPDEHIFSVATVVNRPHWRCVPETEMNNILSHCHDGAVGGHYGGRTTATKVLEVGFYWPTLFKDARNYIATCDKCQRSSNISKRDEMSLNSILVCEIFDV
ncbi:uncharacterized protein LOC107783747 [Nicotiana tabacum]|uniref:Uncharacterized protein LOC107783747 n=1 Tax=Nicotiana tabacum TaxID=4097 RepID=A0AC58U4E9_TOBAC